MLQVQILYKYLPKAALFDKIISGMKIASLNTWGTDGPYLDRWHYFFSELGRLDLDILLLQEVFDPSLLEQIAKGTHLIHHVIAPKTGLAIATRVPVSSQDTAIFQTKSELEDYDRGMALAALEINSQKITAVNTHLSWKPEDSVTRLGQAKELIDRLRGIENRILLAGDLNDVPDSATLEWIRASGYRDLYASCHPNDTGYTWDNRNPFVQSHSVQLPDRRIDFLFLDQKWWEQVKVTLCDVYFNRPNATGIYPSDHYGLVAEING